MSITSLRDIRNGAKFAPCDDGADASLKQSALFDGGSRVAFLDERSAHAGRDRRVDIRLDIVEEKDPARRRAKSVGDAFVNFRLGLSDAHFMRQKMRVEKPVDAEFDAARPMHRIDIAETGEAMAGAKRGEKTVDPVKPPDHPMLEAVEKSRPVEVETPSGDKRVGEVFRRQDAAFEKIELRQAPPLIPAKIERMRALCHRAHTLAAAKIDNHAAEIEQQNGWRIAGQKQCS